VIPGLTTTDVSTLILRSSLSHLRYSVTGWELGINDGDLRRSVPRLIERVITLGSPVPGGAKYTMCVGETTGHVFGGSRGEGAAYFGDVGDRLQAALCREWGSSWVASPIYRRCDAAMRLHTLGKMIGQDPSSLHPK